MAGGSRWHIKERIVLIDSDSCVILYLRMFWFGSLLVDSLNVFLIYCVLIFKISFTFPQRICTAQWITLKLGILKINFMQYHQLGQQLMYPYMAGLYQSSNQLRLKQLLCWNHNYLPSHSLILHCLICTHCCPSTKIIAFAILWH